MVAADSMSKGKQVVFDISSSEEDNVEDDDEDEEDSDSWLQEEDEEDDDASEGEEEDPEFQEDVESDDEESESDQEGDVESDETSGEDEEYESISNEDQSSDDDDGKCFDRKEGKPSDKELSGKVFNLLRQRNTKLDVLKLEECKAYLRIHELMISGSKATCIQRILEHWRVKDGNGERLYPKSSFTINCTGDVCKGDVVTFKQRVYEKFDKVSRRGKEIGRRTIAGRIVKESYGDRKQQHTFTVEVLWSKGIRTLPPLHPLRVKGRNLYRYKTFRQHWRIEAERSKVLEEKHRRGATARLVRASTKARISAGSKRQRITTCSSRQPHNKRLKKEASSSSSSSKAIPPRKSGQKTGVNRSSKKKHAAGTSSVKHYIINNNGTKKTTSSELQYKKFEAKPLHFPAQRPTFHNINYNNNTNAGRERFHIPAGYNYRNNAAPAFTQMRGTFHASQFGPRGHLGYPYSTSHFFTPDFDGNKFADFRFGGRRQR